MSEVLLLYSHCILVKGAVRATVNDLQRGALYIIPLSFADLFVGGRYCRVAETEALLDPEDKGTLKGYIDFLQKHELAFFCEEKMVPAFPELNTSFLFAGQISNCVLDACGRMDYFNASFLQQLTALGCRFIQFRFYEGVDLDYLQQVMEEVNRSRIQSVEILYPAQPGTPFERTVVEWVARQERISSMILHGAAEDGTLRHGHNGMGFVVKCAGHISDATQCGVTDQSLFSINIPSYTEALHYNSCLNRKISIDVSGAIKNCPSMKDSYGNIRDTSLLEALLQPGFKKYWNIRKDEIAVCSDCEFRYVCTDCRAYIEEPRNDRSKPLKCGYDPYTATWQDWRLAPFHEDVILFYGMRR